MNLQSRLAFGTHVIVRQHEAPNIHFDPRQREKRQDRCKRKPVTIVLAQNYRWKASSNKEKKHSKPPISHRLGGIDFLLDIIGCKRWLSHIRTRYFH